MMNRIALAAVLVAAPVGAQEWQVARDQFAFVGRALTIDLSVSVPGTLQVIRGQPGLLHVAGRSDRGFTGFGLDRRDRLTLSAAGAGRADYLVTVPEGVRVRVRLPGRYEAENVAGSEEVRSFQWEAAAERAAAAPALTILPPAEDPLGPSLFTTYSDPRAPRVVRIPEVASVRTVSVRIEGDRFRVAASRPLSLAAGDPELLEIRPEPPALDVTIIVPQGTPEFMLRMGAAPAVVINDDVITALCRPVMEQRFPGGRVWFTFTPTEGRLDCEVGPGRRPGGD